MTNERAIQILENLTSIDGDVIIGSEDMEALEMAIRSLQQGQQEQPDKRLEEAADTYAEKHGFRVPYDGSNNYYDEVDVKASKEGFIAGAKWDREQMLKNAKDGYVSAIIIHSDGDEVHYAVTYPNGERPHSITDKVKIIIL